MASSGWSRRVANWLAARRAPEHFRMTLRDWLLRHQREIVFRECRWLGVTTYKNPLDAWILQEIVCDVRPELIVEIGSAKGGSAMFLCTILDQLGGGRLLSVDVDHSGFAARSHRIDKLTGDSAAPEIRSEVARLAHGKRTLVIHDGDHRKDNVLADLEAYAPLVSVGSYCVVEDGIIDQFEHGDGIGTREEGPLAAVEAFLAHHPEFVVDETRERYLLTYNPSGYLKRVS
jgi:cephalosporin hydroxylase